MTALLAGLIFCAVATGAAVCLRRFARRLADAEWLDTEPTQTDDGAVAPGGTSASVATSPAVPSSPNYDESVAVQYGHAEYADNPLVFSATPQWLQDAVDAERLVPTFRGEDYWYLLIRASDGETLVGPGGWVYRSDVISTQGGPQ